jgi:hypothetical protein
VTVCQDRSGESGAAVGQHELTWVEKVRRRP